VNPDRYFANGRPKDLDAPHNLVGVRVGWNIDTLINFHDVVINNLPKQKVEEKVLGLDLGKLVPIG
jgi:hypothetical protein